MCAQAVDITNADVGQIAALPGHTGAFKTRLVEVLEGLRAKRAGSVEGRPAPSEPAPDSGHSGHRRLVHHSAVEEMHFAIRVLRVPRVVRHHADR